MRSRLDQISAGYDRTAEMGAFPHDETATPLDTRDARSLLTAADDQSADAADRDHLLVPP